MELSTLLAVILLFLAAPAWTARPSRRQPLAALDGRRQPLLPKRASDCPIAWPTPRSNPPNTKPPYPIQITLTPSSVNTSDGSGSSSSGSTIDLVFALLNNATSATETARPSVSGTRSAGSTTFSIGASVSATFITQPAPKISSSTRPVSTALLSSSSRSATSMILSSSKAWSTVGTAVSSASSRTASTSSSTWSGSTASSADSAPSSSSTESTPSSLSSSTLSTADAAPSHANFSRRRSRISSGSPHTSREHGSGSTTSWSAYPGRPSAATNPGRSGHSDHAGGSGSESDSGSEASADDNNNNDDDGHRSYSNKNNSSSSNSGDGSRKARRDVQCILFLDLSNPASKVTGSAMVYLYALDGPDAGRMVGSARFEAGAVVSTLHAFACRPEEVGFRLEAVADASGASASSTAAAGAGGRLQSMGFLQGSEVGMGLGVRYGC
ncbi:hypothetical protein N658DRAFT_495253 [Parathielavia hyrcaniae]|uniref:Uncharacterized protein n=1 Tax=Parathielavia hyrcaniae TaxID=113614 RepID=A0AAN6Q694_9PEZI|nr:hypothetical protein N658DRAFT_495253 [Parathielavia hyrcaniae]